MASHRYAERRCFGFQKAQYVLDSFGPKVISKSPSRLSSREDHKKKERKYYGKWDWEDKNRSIPDSKDRDTHRAFLEPP